MTGRSDRYVDAILPAPYCLLLSIAWVDGMSFHYALNVTDGSVAWQWPLAPLGDMTQAVQLLPSADPDRVYALASFNLYSGQTNEYTCGVLAALHSGNGTAIWQIQLCFHPSAGVEPAFTILQPPPSNSTQGERLLLALSSIIAPYTDDGVITLLDGHTGNPLWSTSLSNASSGTLDAVGDGSSGYFTLLTTLWPTRQQLYRLVPDRTISAPRDTLALTDVVLRSQPALRYENSSTNSTLLVARDVASDKQVWASTDTFLIGADWTPADDTFTHFSTAYELVDTAPELFIVINTAYYDNSVNITVVAQAGVYQLADGKEVSRSPLLMYKGLDKWWDNPTTWQFGDTLLLRGDTVWYTLQLPSLQLVGAGQYATPDASVRSNNWLVDPDGSYVALLYHDNAAVAGYPSVVNNQQESAGKQSDGGVQHRHMRGA